MKYKCSMGREFSVEITAGAQELAAYHAVSMWMIDDYCSLEVVNTSTGEVFKFRKGVRGPVLMES